MASDLAAAATAAAMILTSIPTLSISASAEAKLATTQAIATRLATTALRSHGERYCPREHNKSHQYKLSLHVPHSQLQYTDSHKNNTRCTKSRAVQAWDDLEIQKSNSRSSLSEQENPQVPNSWAIRVVKNELWVSGLLLYTYPSLEAINRFCRIV